MKREPPNPIVTYINRAPTFVPNQNMEFERLLRIERMAGNFIANARVHSSCEATRKRAMAVYELLWGEQGKLKRGSDEP